MAQLVDVPRRHTHPDTVTDAKRGCKSEVSWCFSTVTFVLLYFSYSLARSSIADDAFALMLAGFRGSYIAFSSGLGWSSVYSVDLATVHVSFYNLCCRMISDFGSVLHSKSVQADHDAR
ncbi:MAG: hypothetical protein K2X52_28770 [Mycobacteriaceae bacterium]|nr:hypothetical protein [Mycobacteriaceae bacterium]